VFLYFASLILTKKKKFILSCLSQEHVLTFAIVLNKTHTMRVVG
jgi:hypothetical protein